MRLIPLLLCFTLLSACARTMDNTTYSSSAPVGKVVYGTIVSARGVTIKDNDKLSGNATGILAGGAAGAAGGSAIGKGHGNTAAIVGGAIVGAIAGALIEDQLSTQDGIEYIVKLDATPATRSATGKKRYAVGTQASIDDDIKQSITLDDTATDVISVLQSTDNPIPEGTRVMVIYHDDRPRLVPAR